MLEIGTVVAHIAKCEKCKQKPDVADCGCVIELGEVQSEVSDLQVGVITSDRGVELWALSEILNEAIWDRDLAEYWEKRARAAEGEGERLKRQERGKDLNA